MAFSFAIIAGVGVAVVLVIIAAAAILNGR